MPEPTPSPTPAAVCPFGCGSTKVPMPDLQFGTYVPHYRCGSIKSFQSSRCQLAVANKLLEEIHAAAKRRENAAFNDLAKEILAIIERK